MPIPIPMPILYAYIYIYTDTIYYLPISIIDRSFALFSLYYLCYIVLIRQFPAILLSIYRRLSAPCHSSID